MMKPFIHDDFLLESESARRLYHDHAAKMPVFDYHNHLPPEDVAADRGFSDITDIWLGGDHYKWRAMRSNGIAEEKITGDAPSRERFRAWAETVPATLRNPLYHWTHLELARYFGIDDVLLGPDTADAIYDRCNEMLASDDFSACSLLERMKVKVLCTTDDPADSLKHHAVSGEKGNRSFTMLPAWRPDRALKAEDPAAFNAWIDALEKAAGRDIVTLNDFRDVLSERHDFFHRQGCRLSDYGVETPSAEDFSEGEVKTSFKNLRAGRALDSVELGRYRSAMMFFLASLDGEKDWTMQIHMGVLRNNNTVMFERLGPDTGFDSIGDFQHAKPLVRLLDRLLREDKLPRTILYPINPADNAMVASLIGCFQGDGVPGKMQFGTAWWFLDQLKGMEEQVDTLSAMGLLARFVGMTTDSRSYLSFPRHEYVRRLLCNILGRDMERGLGPFDFDLV